MKDIIIINTTQFGYHIDSLMYTRFVDKRRYAVSYMCFDLGFDKVHENDVRVIYVKVHKNKLFRHIKFIQSLRIILNESNKKYQIFHVYNKFNLLVRLLFWKQHTILDIRTGSLAENEIIRRYKNFEIKVTSLFYKRISIIAHSLAKEIGIMKESYKLLPLGGLMYDLIPKTFEKLRLLYVGTLDKRDLHVTIAGIGDYIKKFPEKVESYDIVGSGEPILFSNLQKQIDRLGLSEIVKLHGRKKHEDLLPFFEKCNVGIVYVPLRPYYNFQPSTKLFEYVLAGMPVIATKTYENKVALNINSGVLCSDNADSFCDAISMIKDKSNYWDSDQIKNLYKKNEWSYITKHYFEPLFQ